MLKVKGVRVRGFGLARRARRPRVSVPVPATRVVTVWGGMMKYFLVLTQVIETFVIGSSRPAAVVKLPLNS